MVFLVLTRAGFEELKQNFGRLPSPLWINKDILSEAEFAELRDSGVEITSFARHIHPDEQIALDGAVGIVQGQHAGSAVWVEHAAPSEKMPGAGAAPSFERTRDTADWKRMLQTLVGRADDLFDHARMRLRRVVPFDAPVMIQPYLGYGTAEKLVLNGRVLKDERLVAPGQDSTAWRNLVDLYKRLASSEIPGARVRARFQTAEKEAVADLEGYFNIEMALAQPLDTPGWHTVELDLLDPAPNGKAVQTMAQVLVPPATARFGVISDIDDTVVWTNVANKLRMLLMLTRSNAHTRKPFKGVAAFYRALRRGAGGSEDNPVFYVSSSPWNLYMPLVEYMTVQGLPSGPLFLRDFGDHTLFALRDHHTHKLASIEQILHAFPYLQFILIGDSGEQDPEIYSQIVRLYPRRIRVIYIRNVNPDPSRIEAIDRLIEDVRQTGAQLVLTPDSEFAAAHAASEGLISAADLEGVRLDKKEDESVAAAFGEPEDRRD
jgi:phosphatidate phosphatase APP1